MRALKWLIAVLIFLVSVPICFLGILSVLAFAVSLVAFIVLASIPIAVLFIVGGIGIICSIEFIDY
jgi:hypothetical protein